MRCSDVSCRRTLSQLRQQNEELQFNIESLQTRHDNLDQTAKQTQDDNIQLKVFIFSMRFSDDATSVKLFYFHSFH